MAGKIQIPWWPQPRQLTFMRACGLAHPFDGGSPQPAQAKVIGYGGAAGGGKSDALMGAGIVAGLSYPGINIGYFRRRYTQLEGPGGAVMRSQALLTSWCKWQGQFRRWTFPTRSILQFCHVDSEAELENFQSQQFDVLLFDESTQFTEAMIRYLVGSRLRATTDNEDFVPFAAEGTNPGSVRHGEFKRQFVQAGEPEKVHQVEVQPGKYESHIFIPAYLADNQILEKRDPSYRQNLENLPDVLRRQLLEGDWDIFAGMYYPEYSTAIHVVAPFEIPDYWRRFRSLDYGLDCTACYWWAVSTDGRCYIYRELYEKNLSLSMAARKIVDMTPASEKMAYTVASPDLWNRRQTDGTPTGEEEMRKYGLNGLVRAEDSRVMGWRILREYLQPYPDINAHVIGGMSARLLIFRGACPNLERTLPEFIFSTRVPEDVSDSCEDHAGESIRYGACSRPPKSVTPEDNKRRDRARQQTRRSGDKVTGY